MNLSHHSDQVLSTELDQGWSPLLPVLGREITVQTFEKKGKKERRDEAEREVETSPTEG